MELEGLLDRRVQEEEKLGEARDALEQIDQQVREREESRSRDRTTGPGSPGAP